MSIFRPSLAGFTAAQLDADVLAFATTTGATDLQRLNKLVRYVKAEGLWSDFVIYPLKSAQNYGTGSTVAPLGGLTSNVMTLMNGAPWTATGVTFNGSTQYAKAHDFLSSGDLSVFLRIQEDVPFGVYTTALVSQATSDRSFTLYNSSVDNKYRILRSLNGDSFANWYSTPEARNTQETLMTMSLPLGSGCTFHFDGIPETMTQAGAGNLDRYNSSDPITLAAQGNGGYLCECRIPVAAFIETEITPTQRARIETLIEAL